MTASGGRAPPQVYYLVSVKKSLMSSCCGIGRGSLPFIRSDVLANTCDFMYVIL
jgi:hypothetical protein